MSVFVDTTESGRIRLVYRGVTVTMLPYEAAAKAQEIAFAAKSGTPNDKDEARAVIAALIRAVRKIASQTEATMKIAHDILD